MQSQKNSTASTISTIKTSESDDIVGMLHGRYGALALTRAAGQAAEAERKGDSQQCALWRRVITDMRQNVLLAESWI